MINNLISEIRNRVFKKHDRRIRHEVMIELSTNGMLKNHVS